jgi:hypothetical protein
MATPDSTTTPVSRHSTGLANIHQAQFLDFSPYQPQLNPNGALQLLLSSGARSVALDQDQDIKIAGNFRTETGGRFERRVGAKVTGAPGKHSVIEVDGVTTNLYKKDVTEVFRVDQTNTQPDLLVYTINGLQINQTSPHTTTVTGTNTKIQAGNTTEHIAVLNEATIVYLGTAYGEQYRGIHMKGFTGAVNADIFCGMRSEFVELFQFNCTLGRGLIVHLVLKVLQVMGSATSIAEIHYKTLESKMHALETNIHGARARFQQMSARGGVFLLGLWRILF